MAGEKLHFKLKIRAELLKNLAERYPDFDREEAELSARIRAVAESLEAARDTALERYGLSQGKLAVLAYLLNAELMHRESQGPSEIAEALGVTPATVTGLLDGLERDGFLQRRPHPLDRRALTVQMTDKSRRFLDEYMPLHSRQLHDYLSGLTAEERRTLAALLDKLVREG